MYTEYILNSLGKYLPDRQIAILYTFAFLNLVKLTVITPFPQNNRASTIVKATTYYR